MNKFDLESSWYGFNIALLIIQANNLWIDGCFVVRLLDFQITIEWRIL